MSVTVVLQSTLCLCLLAGSVMAQPLSPGGSVMTRGRYRSVYDPDLDYTIRTPQMVSMRDRSWTLIDPIVPPTVKLHDIIMIIVDEKSELTLRSGFDRQRTSNLKAELKDFIRIGKRKRLENAAENQPTIDGNVTERMQTAGRLTDQEGLRYRIAAQVVNVLPNGNLVLVARKSIRTDRDVWQFLLTGVLSSKNVLRDGTALSESIADLKIVKTRAGKVSDSTTRRWGQRLIDKFWPF